MLLLIFQGYTFSIPFIEKLRINLMMKTIILLCLCIYSVFAFPNEHSGAVQSLVKSLTECNDLFFSNISKYKNELIPNVPIEEISDQLAYIPVKNRKMHNANYVQFAQPIRYGSLIINGYYDNSLNLGKRGDYYFWGFVIDNSLEEIRSELNFLSWTEIEKDSLYTFNLKIHRSEDSIETWHNNPNTNIGIKTMPAPGTAEKLLLLEKTPDATYLVCSLQGYFPPEVLAIIRPDIINQ